MLHDCRDGRSERKKAAGDPAAGGDRPTFRERHSVSAPYRRATFLAAIVGQAGLLVGVPRSGAEREIPAAEMLKPASLFFCQTTTVNPGGFIPWVITDSDVFKSALFVIADMVGAAIEIFIAKFKSFLRRIFDQFAAKPLFAISFIHKKCAQPGAKIHTADKIIGNQTAATDYFTTVTNQKPLRQR